jgi:hypothetical protein
VALRAYPNPTAQVVNLDFPLSEDASLMVQVFDISGRSMMQNNMGRYPRGQTKLTLDVSTLASGRYVIDVADGQNVLYRFPVIKSLD